MKTVREKEKNPTQYLESSE